MEYIVAIFSVSSLALYTLFAYSIGYNNGINCAKIVKVTSKSD